MHVRSSSDVTVFYLSGVIHRETSESISTAVNTAIQGDSKMILLSFQNAVAVLSEGIRLLIALCDKARTAGKEFYITDLSKEVKYTLQIANLLKLLGFAGSTVTFLQEKQITDPALLVDAAG